jgi:putative oxidoreductase
LESRAGRALLAIRFVVATLIFVHGSFRLFSGGVAGFGEFLNGQHFPAGTAIAWWITIAEIVGSLTLALGRFVQPLAIYFAAELTMGIILVHRHDGWFVVGGGRNGMEYSVLLISSLLIIAYGAGRDG